MSITPISRPVSALPTQLLSLFGTAPQRPARPAQDFTPYAICRDITLPTSGRILDHVKAVEACYLRLTGRAIQPHDAIRVLDRILEERAGTDDPYSPLPLPARLAPLCDWLQRNGYNKEATYLAVRTIDRTGTARGCGCLDGCDVEYVEALLGQIRGDE